MFTLDDALVIHATEHIVEAVGKAPMVLHAFDICSARIIKAETDTVGGIGRKVDWL